MNQGMTNLYIEKILLSNSRTRKVYGGTWSADTIPPIKIYPTALVINEDLEGNPGTHWVAIFAKSPRTIFYFDSFAGNPKPLIQKYLKKFRRVEYSKQGFQGIDSSVCGAYVIFFIYMCARGFSLRQIEKILSDK